MLNLYACLGGNRLLWDNCEVTAVEIDPVLCELYQERFPNDTVICGDAHQYLLDHYKEYDFVWSSPPCPTHSKARFFGFSGTQPKYPDMTLYQEIIFLMHHAKNQGFVVENVKPYYTPLIPAQERGRHLYWANFKLPMDIKDQSIGVRSRPGEMRRLREIHQYDFSKYTKAGGKTRIDKIARNLVEFQTGKAIFDAFRNRGKEAEQIKLFDYEY